MKKSLVLLVLAVVLSTFLIVNCTRNTPTPPPAPPEAVTSIVTDGQVTLNWEPVPGADGYQVRINFLGSSSRGWGDWVNVEAPPYQPELDPGTYAWQVRAVKGLLTSAAVLGTQFVIPEEPVEYLMTLTLTEVLPTDIEEEEEIAQRVTLLPTLWIKPPQEEAEGLSQRAGLGEPPFNILLGSLETDHPGVDLVKLYLGGGFDQAVTINPRAVIEWPNELQAFTLEELEEFCFYYLYDGVVLKYFTEPGIYWLQAVAVGNESIKSERAFFEVRELEPQIDASIQTFYKVGTCSEEEFEGDYICGTEDGLTVVYEITVDLLDEIWIDGWWAEFEVAGAGEDAFETVTITEASTEISIDFATDCTKYATLTLFATVLTVECEEGECVLGDPVLWEFDPVTRVFQLDLLAPEAEFVALTGVASATERVLTFAATDKCIEMIEFDFFVEKGIGDWEAEFIWEFDEEAEFDIGTGDHLIQASLEASWTKASQYAPITVWGTVTLDLTNHLDAATLTATMTTWDCCDVLGCWVPNPEELHWTEKAIDPIFIDNVFFSYLWDEADYLDVDLEECDGNWVVNATEVGTITITFADANWDGLIGDIQTNLSPLSVSTITSTLTTVNPKPVEHVCTGWATKTYLELVITLIGQADIEGEEVTIIATATDNEGNVQVVEIPVWVDTVPPTLTHFRPYRNQPTLESYIEFTFDETPVEADLLLTDVQQAQSWAYDLDDADPVLGQPLTFRLFTGVSLTEGATYTLAATSTDCAGNIGFSELTALSAASPAR